MASQIAKATQSALAPPGGQAESAVSLGSRVTPPASESRGRYYHVVKRDGTEQPMLFDKITKRLKALCTEVSPQLTVEPTAVTQAVAKVVASGMTTEQIDTLAADTASRMSTTDPQFDGLAARIAVSNYHKRNLRRFPTMLDWVRAAHANVVHIGPGVADEPAPLVSDELLELVTKHRERIDATISHDSDYEYTYFGFQTLVVQSYLLKMDGVPVELPQYANMRVALGIHGSDIDSAIESYKAMASMSISYATPTRLNAGTPKAQLSSCFLLVVAQDSTEAIYDLVKECANCSKHAGGVGFAISRVRSDGSYIKGSNGVTGGVVPMLRVFNAVARHIDQGGGKRKGAFAPYLEPWHGDIMGFLELRKQNGSKSGGPNPTTEERRTRDLHPGLWIPDLLMERAERGERWSLFTSSTAPGLDSVWGDEFRQLYERYEREGRAVATVPAEDVCLALAEAWGEAGVPFPMFKDACNRKSNHQHLGTLVTTNLCTEILQYCSAEEIATCNLASITLPKMVDTRTMTFDHDRLYRYTRQLVRDIDRVIDRNYYFSEKIRRSNERHRPMGLGCQGLADVFHLLRLPWGSPGSLKLNREIYETMYYAALDQSCDLAREHGPHPSYEGSPVSKGILQFDMWEAEGRSRPVFSGRWDWAALKRRIALYGVRHSLLIAQMPTATTAQIMGNNESFEPYMTNLFKRVVLAGEFTVLNTNMVNDLMRLGLWSAEMKDRIILNGGSVQNIPEIPAELREIYRTAYEISGRVLIDMAAERGAFIDQSQSLNMYMRDPDVRRLLSMIFYAWKKGLKGMYYLKSNTSSSAHPIAVDPALIEKERQRLREQRRDREKEKEYGTKGSRDSGKTGDMDRDEGSGGRIIRGMTRRRGSGNGNGSGRNGNAHDEGQAAVSDGHSRDEADGDSGGYDGSGEACRRGMTPDGDICFSCGA